MAKIIGVLIEDRQTWHAAGIFADYDTLCGIDANDPNIGHNGTIEPKSGQKIDCSTCKTMWLNMRALRLRATDFEEIQATCF